MNCLYDSLSKETEHMKYKEYALIHLSSPTPSTVSSTKWVFTK